MHTITAYLGKRDVKYSTVAHRHTLTTNQTAQEVHVPRERVAKGVLFCNEEDYVLAVVPASRRVDPGALSEVIGHGNLTLASEDELAYLFPDCELGAVPAVGAAYGLPSIVDESLFGEEEIYLEAGDHQSVVHISGADFRRIMQGVSHADITAHA
jgi:Ala-tRNA(Pro) deacylase